MREKLDTFGEDNREIIWQAVGQAMSEFQKIERALEVLFMNLLNGNNTVSRKIFRTAPSLRGRLELIANAAKGFQAQGTQDFGISTQEIKKCANLVLAAAKYRNFLAHSSVVQIHQFPSGNYGFWLLADGDGRSFHFNCADISTAIESFEPARKAIISLTRKLQR